MVKNMDILIDGETGEMLTMERIRVTPHWKYVGRVDINHPTRKALDIGQKVMACVADGWEINADGYCVSPLDENTQHLILKLLRVPPAPPKGLDWLKSRTPGGTYTAPTNVKIVFMITTEGLSWADGDVWTWDGRPAKNQGLPDWRTERWVQNACSETCPAWKPE